MLKSATVIKLQTARETLAEELIENVCQSQESVVGRSSAY